VAQPQPAASTRVVRTRAELREALSNVARPLGLVTTMGWLHDGHRATGFGHGVDGFLRHFRAGRLDLGGGCRCFDLRFRRHLRMDRRHHLSL